MICRVLLAALLLVVGLGILVGLPCIFFADPIIRFAGSESDTHDSAVAHFCIIMGGMMFNIISLVIVTFIRPVASYILAYCFQMGVTGIWLGSVTRYAD